MIENFEAVANQTKTKINEYADKAEEMLDNIKNNFDNKAETISTSATSETEIEIVKLEKVDLATNQAAQIDDSLVYDVNESNQKSTKFSKNININTVSNADESKTLNYDTNDLLRAEKSLKKNINPIIDGDKKEH